MLKEAGVVTIIMIVWFMIVMLVMWMMPYSAILLIVLAITSLILNLENEYK